jgi:hypothetical protein
MRIAAGVSKLALAVANNYADTARGLSMQAECFPRWSQKVVTSVESINQILHPSIQISWRLLPASSFLLPPLSCPQTLSRFEENVPYQLQFQKRYGYALCDYACSIHWNTSLYDVTSCHSHSTNLLPLLYYYRCYSWVVVLIQFVPCLWL